MFHTRQPVYLFQHNVYIYAVHKTIFDMYHESFLNLLIVKFVQFYNHIHTNILVIWLEYLSWIYFQRSFFPQMSFSKSFNDIDIRVISDKHDSAGYISCEFVEKLMNKMEFNVCSQNKVFTSWLHYYIVKHNF